MNLSEKLVLASQLRHSSNLSKYSLDSLLIKTFFSDEPRSLIAEVENAICGKSSVWEFVLNKTKKNLRAKGAKAVCSPSTMPSKV